MASQSGVERDALGSYGTGASQAGAAFNAVDPKYRQFIQNPQGFTPQQKADLITSTLQTGGGTTAGAVGQGGLFATRTNNAGAATAAIDDAARTSGTTATDAALGIGEQDADLARKQQLIGLQGEQGLYDSSSANALRALGIADSSQQASANRLQRYIGMGLSAAGAAAGA